MRIAEIDVEALSDDRLGRLVMGDRPYRSETGDVIFVFGGRNLDRVRKAAALYHAGKAPLLCLSGGTKFGQRNPAEAVTMREEALRLGVPPEAVLIETDSNHTVENVLCSLVVLHRRVGLHRIRRLIAVTVPWHVRRSLLAMRTYMPGWIEAVPCPAEVPGFDPARWREHPEAAWRIPREARKLVTYVREGLLADEEVGR
ncbi:YdcF family protein [Symbiobacterium terraclitae]|uniref:YdcF family protein n=1 Tax=Symbiobacterium terraclitae TaxID=557451 RepID=UPI0035B50ACC